MLSRGLDDAQARQRPAHILSTGQQYLRDQFLGRDAGDIFKKSTRIYLLAISRAGDNDAELPPDAGCAC